MCTLGLFEFSARSFVSMPPPQSGRESGTMSETWKLELVVANEQSWVWDVPGYGQLQMSKNSSLGERPYLGYCFRVEDGTNLFSGSGFGVPSHRVLDSEETALALLQYVALQPGDTDREYFDRYTEEQLAWARSSQCEALGADLSARCAELGAT